MPSTTLAFDWSELEIGLSEGHSVRIETETTTSGNASVETHITTQANDTKVEVHNDDVTIETPKETKRLKLDPNMEITTEDGVSISTSQTSSGSSVTQVSQTSSETRVSETLRHKNRSISVLFQEDPATTLETIDLTTQVETNEDISVVSHLASGRNRILDVSVATSAVAVGWQEEVRLFGLVPLTLSSTVEVHEQGEVRIARPWYAALCTGLLKDDEVPDLTSAEVETSVYARQASLIDRLTAFLASN